MSEPIAMSSLAVLSSGVVLVALGYFRKTIKSLSEEVEDLVTNVWTIERRSHRVTQDRELDAAFTDIQEKAADLELAVERLRGAAQREAYAPGMPDLHDRLVEEVLAKAAAYAQRQVPVYAPTDTAADLLRKQVSG